MADKPTCAAIPIKIGKETVRLCADQVPGLEALAKKIRDSKAKASDVTDKQVATLIRYHADRHEYSHREDKKAPPAAVEGADEA